MSHSILQDRIVVDLLFAKQGHPCVMGKINEIDLCLLIDTGAGYSCIHESYVKSMKLRFDRKRFAEVGAIGNSSRMDAYVITVPHLSLSSIYFIDPLFIAMDLSMIVDSLHPEDKNLLGIIGAHFLQEHKAIIDYSNSSLSLLAPKETNKIKL